MQPAFDIVNLKRTLDTLDPSIGPRDRNLHTSWAMLQAVMSVLRELKYDDLETGLAYTDALRSKQWENDVVITDEDMGFAGDSAILDFSAIDGIVPALLNPHVVPGSVRIDYVNSAGDPAYLVDNGAGVIVDGSTAGDLAGATDIVYSTGVIGGVTGLVFDTGREPEPGQFTVSYTQDAKATFEAHLLALETALTSALSANKALLKA